MKFEEALKLYRDGKPIKLEDWGIMTPFPDDGSNPMLRWDQVMSTDWQEASGFELDAPEGEDT